MSTPYYAQKLADAFDIKRKMNPKYSLRAYARFLGMHPSSLSHILKSQRKPTISQVQTITKRLELTAKEQFLFYGSLDYSINGNTLHQPDIHSDKLLEEENYLKVVSDWRYTAILVLIESRPFSKTLDIDYIQEKFNLKKTDAQNIINDLISLGLSELLS